MRVLVVDDEEHVRIACRLNLSFAGIDVTEARNGAEAVELLAGEPPDLVLLDILMPGVNGWEVLEHMRRDQRLARIPVIMLSALAQREERERALASGASGYIVKPFDVDELVRRVTAERR